MRAKSYQAILTLVALMLFSVVMVSHAAAMRYIGQITWTAEQTEDETGQITPVDFPMTVGIRSNGRFLLYCPRNSQRPPSGIPVILSGGGQIIDSDLLLTMSGSRNNVPWVEGASVYVKVNKTSLNGTFKVISNNFNHPVKVLITVMLPVISQLPHPYL